MVAFLLSFSLSLFFFLHVYLYLQVKQNENMFIKTEIPLFILISTD